MDHTLLWRIRGHILCATFFTLLVFAGLGYGIDRWLGTYPKALIGLILVSFPMSNFFAIRLARRRLDPGSH